MLLNQWQAQQHTHHSTIRNSSTTPAKNGLVCPGRSIHSFTQQIPLVSLKEISNINNFCLALNIAEVYLCLFIDEIQYKTSPEGETFLFLMRKVVSTDIGRLSLMFATISADDLARSLSGHYSRYIDHFR